MAPTNKDLTEMNDFIGEDVTGTDEAVIDTAYLAGHEEEATPAEPLAPGKYYLQLPSKFTIKPHTNKAGQPGAWVGIGATRAIATESGEEVRRGFIGSKAAISTFPKGNRNWSDVSDLLALFDVDPTTITTKATLEQALEGIAGQRTPIAIPLDYQGNYTHPISGQKVYVQSDKAGNNLFKREDGTYARVAYVIDGVFTTNPTFPVTIGEKDYKAQQAHAKAEGWIDVWSNLGPAGFRPFEKPKGRKN